MTFLLPLYTLWLREVIRFFRQRHRVMGAIGQPLLFWLFVGSGLGTSFRPQLFSKEISFLEYFYPGIILMILLFTAIFSTFSIIEDRNEGFLQGVLVSPAPRWMIVLGKVLGGATLATIQATLFLVISPLIGLHLSFLQVTGLILSFLGVALGLTSFGFCLAWRLDSVQGFHALMMLILMPMWFLSGAFFPNEGLPLFLKLLMALNPMAYGLALIRHIFYWNMGDLMTSLPTLQLSMGVILLFTVVCLLMAWRMLFWTRSR